MLNREEFIILLDKYALDTISPAEHSELLAAISSGNYDELVLQHIENNHPAPITNIAGADLPPHRSADILHKILSSEKHNALLIPKNSSKIKIIRWSVAAAIFGSIAISSYFFVNRENKPAFSNGSFASNTEKRINTTTQPLKIEMEEGTIVTLQPGSSIHYPAHFLPEKREVFLEGEAFFEVSKNAFRPFFVYNRNIVTHVLGTSFNVKINNQTNQVEVSVRTGRVEVYENKPVAKNAADKKSNGVILLPNQKVIYYQDTKQFIPSLADVPLPIIDELSDKKTVAESFVFDETRLKRVLGSLEKSYGIDIVVENENLYNCLFTGDISQQALYTRLDIICQSVQASYEVKGTKILIKGAGCN